MVSFVRDVAGLITCIDRNINMHQFKDLEDTIVAISTATGQGGIGIVRLSGNQAVSIADHMFVSRDGCKPSSFNNFTLHYGDVIDHQQNGVVDEALLSVMRAPKSYTRQDVVEISCHGGIVSLRAILMLSTKLGARLAEPGEFTKRAFLNGRIDLAQAEAVLDVIQAKTDMFLKVSTHQLKGDLSLELEAIRQQLMDIYIEIEAIVNFPEDEIENNKEGLAAIEGKIVLASQRVNALVQTGEQGRILKEGIKIVLCGKPNVGKSSLLNVLLKTPRAIVSEISGTTRDTIEETAQIRGIPFQLIDTAGILDPRDLIEKEAVKRSHMHIAGADLILFVFDASDDLTVQDEHLMASVTGGNIVIVLNKSDLQQKIDLECVCKRYKNAKVVEVSALKRLGIDELEGAIVDNVWDGKTSDTHGILVSNGRHIQSLTKCLESLKKGKSILTEKVSLEFVSEEIKLAINFLDNITGRNIDQDLLDNIFSQFCIGK